MRLFGLNSQYAFSSTLSWNNLIQYDNVSENLGINSRLHWIPKAGQQAFLVLNWGLIDTDKDNSKYLESIDAKASMIKTLWEKFLQGDKSVLDEIRLHAHSLKRTGATF